MKDLRLKIVNVILPCYFLIIGINISSSTGYLAFGIILVFFFLTRRKFYIRTISWDLIPLIFLLVWSYGLTLGFYHGNKPGYIVANNAGMTLYLLYYILLQVRIAKEKVYNLLLISGFTISAITILFFLFNAVGIPPKLTKSLLGDFTGGASTGQQRVYFVSQISLFPALAVYMTGFIASKYQKLEHFNIKDFRRNLMFALAFIVFTICVMFLTASKGFMLGYLFLLLFIPFALFSKSIFLGRINKRIIVFIILIAVLLGLLLSFGYFNIITAIFDQEDLGNMARYEQMYFLIQDLTVWGKGLGAVIPGYSRNLDKPYGFELSYLNLIHKFGIFGLVTIVLYITTFWKALKNITRGTNVRYAIASVGAICYLLPSIGNPLIFAPQAVALHCAALYLLRNDRNEKEHDLRLHGDL